ncbi:hypothetical protein [Ferrovibrio sp.]|uniref:hypothetical protein n=1 Tax=Ferrovibrio sp. TaxID=1917215 RepID=UPI0025BA8D71|nr:hypothetical protein [Ferrovibrio sp.]MBX3454031.1 hypothetical protein [Ferrovibrio sp.]
MRWPVLPAALLLLLMFAVPAWACLPGFEAATTLTGNGQSLSFRSDPAPMPLGKPFALEIAVCPPPRGLAVDAHMPAHRHGMNYRPSIRDLGGGRYRAEGLMLHMPGAWEFVFDIEGGAGRARLTSAYTVR